MRKRPSTFSLRVYNFLCLCFFCHLACTSLLETFTSYGLRARRSDFSLLLLGFTAYTPTASGLLKVAERKQSYIWSIMS